MIFFFCVCLVGIFQPAEDRTRDGQDDDTQQRICLSAAGHGETVKNLNNSLCVWFRSVKDLNDTVLLSTAIKNKKLSTLNFYFWCVHI